ncbi:MAG: leucine-rich repeat domain-containing protein, partial [Oscillospiraceae bacterium]|nr:leucine-rich repeat domain-containing protein [Oscillospiraceae bacterium]
MQISHNNANIAHEPNPHKKQEDKTMRKTGKLLSLLLCLALALALLPSVPAQAAGDVAINATNFPDANFRSYVSGNCDSNGDGKLSAREIAAVTYIGCFNKNIASLKGIEHFTALTELYCYNNQLTALDVSGCTALTKLWCGVNRLTSLDVSKNTALT